MKRDKISHLITLLLKKLWNLDISRKLVLISPDKLKNFVNLVLCYRIRQVNQKLTRNLIKSKFNKKVLKKRENYLRIHLGDRSERIHGYIILNYQKTKTTDIVWNIINLPFPDKSIELIEVNYIINYLPINILLKALRNWWFKLIPGGKLIIDQLDTNRRDIQHFIKILKNCGYQIIKTNKPQDYSEFPKPYMRIEAYKSIYHKMIQASNQIMFAKREKRITTIKVEREEKRISSELLNQLEKDFVKEKSCVCLECGIINLENFSDKINYDMTFINISKEKESKGYIENENLENINNLELLNNSFDAGYAFHVIEYIEPGGLENFFSEIKRILKPNGKFLVATRYKDDQYDPNQRQFFTKSLLAEFFDQINLSFDWMQLEKWGNKSHDQNMLKAMIINKTAFQVKQKRKICVLGNFGYFGTTQLGFHFDGQMRAFRELGFETQILDFPQNYEILRVKILEFSPDIIWLLTKITFPFIEWMKKDLKKIGCTIINWMVDLRAIEGLENEFNLPLHEPIINPKKIGSILDYYFLSNAGQIQDYKKAYQIENLYYMPQACTPSFHHRVDLKEKYDIVFIGSMNENWAHKERTKLIREISNCYNTKTMDDVRNNIAEIYSSSKIGFGADLTYGQKFENYFYLCCSNRIFIALGCGAFYLCHYFPGLEKLAVNHKHLVWFKTKKELFELIDYYLSNADEREKIRQNAEELAHSKHTYVHRVQNMIDIIDGKTNEFYGFLKEK